MKQILVWLSRVSLALAIAVSLNIDSAAAASPSSSLKALPERINTRSVTLSYVSSGDGGVISKVELYQKKDNGSFVKIATVTTPDDAFVIDFMTTGDGRYAFHTIAYLKNDTATTDDDVAETGKDLLEETATIVDTVNPPAPDSTHLYINQAASLQVNEISGYSKGVEGTALVKVYADAALSTLVAATYANPDGSFGPVEIGTAVQHPYLWVVAIDANGNRSVATLIENKLSFNAAVTNLKVTPLSETQLDVTYTAPTNATEYIVYYRHAGGAVWSAMVRTTDTTAHLTGLEAGRAYDVRVAPVDSSNSVGTYAFSSARTAGTPLMDVVLASENKTPATPVAASGSATGGAATVTTSPNTVVDQNTAANVETQSGTVSDQGTTETPAAEQVTPAPDQTAPAEGAETTEQPAEANQATDENQPSSATPWVILAILIILAGIATGGYFYWFSGPEEVTTTVTDTTTTSDKKTEEKKDEDVDKRW